MSKPIIVTDIDSVLIDICTPINGWLRESYGVRVYESDWIHWDLGESFGIGKKEVDALWNHFVTQPSLPYPGAIDFLNDLQEMGYCVIGLSKRDGELMESGKRDFSCLPLDALYIQGGSKGEFLADTLKLTDADVVAFIDDKPANLRSVEKRFPETELLLFSRPWNHSLDLDPSYLRVHNYEELAEILDPANYESVQN